MRVVNNQRGKIAKIYTQLSPGPFLNLAQQPFIVFCLKNSALPLAKEKFPGQHYYQTQLKKILPAHQTQIKKNQLEIIITGNFHVRAAIRVFLEKKEYKTKSNKKLNFSLEDYYQQIIPPKSKSIDQFKLRNCRLNFRDLQIATREVQTGISSYIYKSSLANENTQFEAFNGFCYEILLPPGRAPKVRSVHGKTGSFRGVISKKVVDLICASQLIKFNPPYTYTKITKKQLMQMEIGYLATAAYCEEENDFNVGNYGYRTIDKNRSIGIKIDHGQSAYPLTQGFCYEGYSEGLDLEVEEKFTFTAQDIIHHPELNYATPFNALHNERAITPQTIEKLKKDRIYQFQKYSTFLKRSLLYKEIFKYAADATISNFSYAKIFWNRKHKKTQELKNLIYYISDFHRFIRRNPFIIEEIISDLNEYNKKYKTCTYSLLKIDTQSILHNYLKPFNLAYDQAINFGDYLKLRPKKKIINFFLAISRGELDEVQASLAKGISADATYLYQYSALMHAAKCNQAEIVKLLIENSAKIDAPDFFGWTALMHAVYLKRPEIVTLLLEAGASVQNETPEGFNALYFAVDNNYRKMTAILVNYHAKLSSQLKARLNHTKQQKLGEILAYNLGSQLRNKIENGDIDDIDTEIEQAIHQLSNNRIVIGIFLNKLNLRYFQNCHHDTKEKILSRLSRLPIQYNKKFNLICEMEKKFTQLDSFLKVVTDERLFLIKMQVKESLHTLKRVIKKTKDSNMILCLSLLNYEYFYSHGALQAIVNELAAFNYNYKIILKNPFEAALLSTQLTALKTFFCRAHDSVNINDSILIRKLKKTIINYLKNNLLEQEDTSPSMQAEMHCAYDLFQFCKKEKDDIRLIIIINERLTTLDSELKRAIQATISKYHPNKKFLAATPFNLFNNEEQKNRLSNSDAPIVITQLQN